MLKPGPGAAETYREEGESMRVVEVMRARVALLLLVAVALLPAVPGTAVAAETTSEHELARLINAERRASGLNELKLQSQLTTIAREWSAQMASENSLYHRPDLGTRVQGDWRGLAENVGYGPSISRLHTAFMESAGHAKNVRGDWTVVGIGVVTSGSTIWVTVNFGRGQIDGTSSPVPDEPRQTLTVFVDVYADAVHAPGIQAMYDAGIVQGKDGRFSPGATITRAQMATYVVNALGLDGSGRASYSDVASGNVHTGSIAAVTEAGIMGACSTGRFCPTDQVTRAEMAQILTDAFDLPTGGAWSFADVPAGSNLADDVSAIAEAGITRGCAVPDSFCPGDTVTRGQMATFFAAALGLL